MSTATTATQPNCPSWCQTKSEHEGEAHERSGSWFAHSAWLGDDGSSFSVSLTNCQLFDEQKHELDEEEDTGIFVNVACALTPTQARDLVELLRRAADLADEAPILDEVTR